MMGAKRTCTVQSTGSTLLLPPDMHKRPGGKTQRPVLWPKEPAFKKGVPVTVYFLLPEGEVENAVLLRCREEGQQQQWRLRRIWDEAAQSCSAPTIPSLSCSDPRGAGQGAHATALVNSSASKGTSQSWMNWSKTLLSFPPQFLPDLEKQSCSLRLTDSQANFYMWFGKNKLLDMS